MRFRKHGLVLVAFFMAGKALIGQPGPQVIHPIQNPQPQPFMAAGQTQTAPNEPSLVIEEPKEYQASPGEQVAPFTIDLTNVWTKELTIDRVHASCGCTTASLPSEPWHIPAHTGGQVHAQIKLAGKMGAVTKTLTFYTSIGIRVVNLKVNIPPPPSISANLTEAERKAAMLKAAADAQVIFKGDCARCHADKGRTAFGQDLYAADCGICHESSHRESLVPDLHALKQPTDFDYWKTIITLGKPHTMMPGFAAANGGPLSEAQINSLANYLNHTISHNLSFGVTNTASAAPMGNSALQ